MMKLCLFFVVIILVSCNNQNSNVDDKINTSSEKDIKVTENLEVKQIPIVLYSDSTQYKFDNSNKQNTLLVFVNKECENCDNIFNDIQKNSKQYLEKYVLVCIAEEDQEKLVVEAKKFNIEIKEVLNSEEIIEYFKVTDFPSTIVLNEKGEQVYKKLGANKDWTLIGVKELTNIRTIHKPAISTQGKIINGLGGFEE